MNGILNVYKEKGYTSHDVVAKLRGILHEKKIGHTGTLDPQAEGVLPVCIGNATKLCGLLTDKRKEYEAVLLLGLTTDTQDMTGTVMSRAGEIADDLTEEKIHNIIMGFLGKSKQIPPMYSALKVNGKKLYELAREGKEVERKPREIEIYKIDIKEVNLPRVRFSVECSKGTYIRTLCADVGEKAGCGGVMESLLRTKVDRFILEDAKKLSEIEAYAAAGHVDEILMQVDHMFTAYPAYCVKETSMKAVQNGNALPTSGIELMQKDTISDVWSIGDDVETEKNSIQDRMVSGNGTTKDETVSEDYESKDTGLIRIYDGSGRFYGLYEMKPKEELCKPYKMFL